MSLHIDMSAELSMAARVVGGDERHATHALEKWRETASLTLAEQLLVHAALLKEVNVLSLHLGMRVAFQFALATRASDVARSAADAIVGDAEDDIRMQHTAGRRFPAVRVRVIDLERRRIDYWTLEKLATAARALRQASAVNRCHTVAKHMHARQLLGVDHFSSYAPIGSAHLAVLADSEVADARIPIWSHFDNGAIGHCRVRLHRSIESGTEAHELTLLDVRLVHPARVGAAHVQIHLAEIPRSGSSAWHSSTPAGSGGALKWSCAYSVAAETRADYQLPIHFYAELTDALVSDIETHDATRESKTDDIRAVCGATAPPVQGRVHEHKRQHERSFGACVRTRISQGGEYAATHNGVVLLDGGLAWHVSVALQHDAGEQLLWTHVTSIALSDVCTVDETGQTIKDRFFTSLPLLDSETRLTPLGTNLINAEARWDAAMYTCKALREPTRGAAAVRLSLTISVNVDAHDEFVHFVVPLHVRVGTGRARGSRAARTLLHTFYELRLTPRFVASATDLWRIDTRAVPVPGEAQLRPWTPRGLSLLNDARTAVRRRDFALSVARTRALLRAKSVNIPTRSESTSTAPLFECLAQWLRAVPAPFSMLQSPSGVATRAPRARIGADGETSVHAIRLDLQECVLLRSWLTLQYDATSDKWLRVWVILQYPFLLVQANPRSQHVLKAIFLHNVHVHDMASGGVTNVRTASPAK